MLCALGDLVEDVVVWLDGPPRRGTDQGARVFRRRGGSAANVAAFAAARGTPARFLGRIGDDELGRRLADDLASYGVDVRVERRGRTGTVVVLVEPDGERTMLPDRAACTELAAVDASWLAGVRVLHLPAYSLTVEPLATAALGAASHARAAGALVSVDASSVSVLEGYGPAAFRRLLASLAPDVLLANAEEAAVLRLAEPVTGVAWTVVKDGPRPVVLRDQGGAEQHFEVPVAGVVTDTTGAGDAFAAGLLGAVVGGARLADAVPAGIALAARVVGQPGASLRQEDA